MKCFMRLFKWLRGLAMAVVHASGFLKALLNAKPSPLETALHRLETCYGCDRLELTTRQCMQCWCFVSLKVRWLDESCPEGKWKL